MIGSNGQRHRVIGIVQQFFYRRDPILLHEQKIGVNFIRQVIMLVVTDARKITQNPWERISACADHMSCQLVVDWVAMCEREEGYCKCIDILVCLHIDVWFSVFGILEIIQPNGGT